MQQRAPESKMRFGRKICCTLRSFMKPLFFPSENEILHLSDPPDFSGEKSAVFWFNFFRIIWLVLTMSYQRPTMELMALYRI